VASIKTDKRVQKTIQWDADVWEALEKHNKQMRLNNMSAAANDAVRYALFPEFRSDREADMTKQFQQLLYSLNEHRKKTARDITILQEGLMQFVLHYFMHTHNIPKGEQDAARAQANARFDGFLEELMQKLSKSRPMAQEVE
jgi:Cft2 family RNA processing exonuclease